MSKSTRTGGPKNDPALCEKSFEVVTKDMQIIENQHKTHLMGTGSGPYQPPKSDDPEEFKKLIEPHIDGMFTIYDSDAELMGQLQQSLPGQERIQPVENKFVEYLQNNYRPKSKTSITDSIQKVSKAKLELVNMQKLLIEKELLHKQKLQELELEDKIKENRFKELKRQKELELVDAKIKNAQLIILNK
ncbi:uncharacterized protein LOC111364490 [Spodoptera litura]|uniref:Uncharacterized protein LOC111364490 n=1 Tax=Spodoptera litura TaxID=69820 RepID=A0A9J7ERB3_SPOLT|nr:uncharacterized protein LOC111364490 [Spodoptera litura]